MRIVKNKNGIRKKQEFYLFNNIQRENDIPFEYC